MQDLQKEIQSSYSSVHEFLHVQTSPQWLQWAVDNQAALLWDHGVCEKKAASSALSLLFRYPQNETLVYRMSRLAREELRHFEQVQKIIQQRKIKYTMVLAPIYVTKLRACIRSDEPNRLIDILIVGAFIEARSCERFELLAPLLDEQLKKFYGGLAEAEARHFQEYLGLAASLCDETQLESRIKMIGQVEADSISKPVDKFAFHSGPPHVHAVDSERV